MQDENVEMLVSAICASLGERTFVMKLESALWVGTGHKLLSGDQLKFQVNIYGELVQLDDDGTTIPRAVAASSGEANPYRDRILRHIHRIWGTYNTPNFFLRLGPIYPEDVGDAVARFAAAALSIDRLLSA